MRALKRLSVATAVGMFLVLLMGATVTKTDSGDGCGTTFPLCNGKFIPAYSIPSIIEYSHRFVSAVVGLMVLACFIMVWKQLKRKDARFYSASALFFTVLQAALGAMAVMWSQSDLVMALHFGFSLIAFAATLLLAITVLRLHHPANPSGWGEDLSNMRPVTHGFRNLVWFTVIYTYIVVYLGAYVRHTDSVSACQGWPLCNGDIIPELSGSIGIAFLHRVAAALLMFVIGWMTYRALKDYPDNKVLKVSAIWSFALILAQIFSGAFVVFSLSSDNWFLLTALIHSLTVSGLFGVLCYMSIIVWQLGGKAPNVSQTQSMS